MKTIVALISGSGTNMLAIHEATLKGVIANAALSCVMCNIPEAPGIDKAKSLGIPTKIINHKDFVTREEFDQALVNKVNNVNPDIIVLAGFMRILSPVFTSAFEGRIINIHPSLLPKYPGLKTHEQVIQNKDSHHGISIHFVNEELDGGPLIAQGFIKVGDIQNKATLQERIQKIEHDLYPKIIHAILAKEISYSSLATIYSPSCQIYKNRIYYDF